MNLKDFRDSLALKDTPKVSSEQVQIIFESDYYDGPINGLAELNNELYWFELIDENENWKEGVWYRRFALLELSSDQIDKEIEVQKDFQRYVGKHRDVKQIWEPPNMEDGGIDKFVEKHKSYIESRPFEKNLVIGCMED